MLDFSSQYTNNSNDQALVAAAAEGTTQNDIRTQGTLLAFQQKTGIDQYHTEDIAFTYAKFIHRMRHRENLRSKFEYTAKPFSRCVACAQGPVLNDSRSHELQLTSNFDDKDDLAKMVAKTFCPTERHDGHCARCGGDGLHEGLQVINVPNIVVLQTSVLFRELTANRRQILDSISIKRQPTKLRVPLITTDAGSPYTYVHCVAIVYLSDGHYWIK